MPGIFFFFVMFVLRFTIMSKGFLNFNSDFLLSQNQYKLVLSQMDVIHQD